MSLSTETLSKIKKYIVIIFAVIIGSVFLLSLLPDSPIPKVLMSIFKIIQNLDIVTSSIIITILHIIAVPFMIPTTPITIVAGIMFGSVLGTIISTIGCTIGAIIVFFITRFVVLETINEYINKNENLKLMQLIVKENGLIFITLLRVSPVFPFPIINYILPPVVDFIPYAIGTLIGLIPCNFVVVYFSASMTNITEVFSSNGMSGGALTMMIITTVISISLIIGITYYVKSKINELKKNQNKSSSSDECLIPKEEEKEIEEEEF
ncbi:SNARE associated Golgi protein [Entamoeba histolytica HM-3:IMSS]|uniref:VTT domain-containing protein n=4 Tax=Entamoeba histolytica TaxID=5759 RepID=C4LYA6_ENTH1|nr:hypothetical protein, conserved [Entamoeba histolytica HM-1:IMSS]EAL49400.1 hypothetical protein, conserved [Entamoeba histolytica HM-1:IMSS]EMS17520.1 SNARE associated Golgi protein [Entamoeba histolytica HM-3:IMSS]ENY65273.1 SNARE associated Golgi protein, putative [Entamoeba histolytica HM-1:IMSS-A]GAT93791.1 hypothetical protein conserved [Entamoeba histolytica]|eukprot:XP_654786.1 hypothetical protein, conserved [Entamoeba histolytica HM-1:IMSS]